MKYMYFYCLQWKYGGILWVFLRNLWIIMAFNGNMQDFNGLNGYLRHFIRNMEEFNEIYGYLLYFMEIWRNFNYYINIYLYLMRIRRNFNYF